MVSVVKLLFILKFALLATASNGEESYAGCLKNYSVLQQAVLEGDLYDIIKAFYPPESSLTSVYVNITYVSTEDSNIREKWLWTSIPVYLIQPPSVFQFTSLLFSHHHISDRIKDLTIHLPPACYNVSTPSCHKGSNNVVYLYNEYLDVLTNEIYLFARYNGRNERIILEDSTTSTSMRLDNNCSSTKIHVEAFYLFNVFCLIVLPALLYFLISLILHTIRPKLRTMLSPSLPKSSIIQNLAALVLTGLVFSTYVVICDICALYYSLSENKLSILRDYENQTVQYITTVALILMTLIDFSTFIFTVVIIIILRFSQADKKCVHHVFRFAYCVCTWVLFKHSEYEHIPEDWCEASKELLQKVNYLQRKEKWLIQKREEKRQDQPANSWLQQWKYDLCRQEDHLQRRENHLKQQQHQLTNKRNITKWEEDLEKWEKNLKKWSDELTSEDNNDEENPHHQSEEQQLNQQQQRLKLKHKELQQDEDKLKEKMNSKTFAENKAWSLVLLAFVSPIACVGTHGGFVIMAWASDADEASSMVVLFTISFFYYFIVFRQLYIRLSSSQCFKLKPSKLDESIGDISLEVEEYHDNLKEINISLLVCELFFVPLFMGIQALVVLSYYYLPGPISMVPLNAMNLLQLVLFFGTGFVTYKVFTFSSPIEEIILDKFVKSYSPQASSSANIAERAGETLGSALRKIVEGERQPLEMSPPA